MSKVSMAGSHIVQLSARHDVDPFGVLGLLALHALCESDFKKLRFWTEVSGSLAQQAA